MGSNRLLDTTGSSLSQQFRDRLTGDHRLLAMTLIVALGALVFIPLALYRLWIGDFFSAGANVAVLLVYSIILLFAWTTGRTLVASQLFAVAAALLCSVMVIGIQQNLHWIHPSILTIFFMAGWRLALSLSVGLIALIAIAGPPFQSQADLVSFLGAATVTVVFAMIFVVQTRMQRDRLTEQVEHCSLTGALTHRVLRRDLELVVSSPQIPGSETVLAVFDLDDFKQVNDSQGHGVGDKVLISLARLVKDHGRRADRFYRMGGEEFVLILTDTGRQGAERALSKLHAVLRDQLRTPRGPVTVSIGAAVYIAGESASEWLARADQAMYTAKSSGKNQLVFAD